MDRNLINRKNINVNNSTKLVKRILIMNNR